MQHAGAMGPFFEGGEKITNAIGTRARPQTVHGPRQIERTGRSVVGRRSDTVGNRKPGWQKAVILGPTTQFVAVF